VHYNSKACDSYVFDVHYNGVDYCYLYNCSQSSVNAKFHYAIQVAVLVYDLVADLHSSC